MVGGAGWSMAGEWAWAVWSGAEWGRSVPGVAVRGSAAQSKAVERDDIFSGKSAGIWIETKINPHFLSCFQAPPSRSRRQTRGYGAI